MGNPRKISSSFQSKKIKTFGGMAALAAMAAAPFFLTACLDSLAPQEVPDRTVENELSVALAITTTRQAEDATLYGAVKASNQTGYTGTGFADYRNASGDYVRWTVSVTTAGKYNLRFRYANGGGANRPLAIKVNGTTVNASFAFPATATWATWATVSLDANLNSGTNTVQATAIGYSGGNVDYLQAYGPVVTTTTRKANLTWFTSYPDPGSEGTMAAPGRASSRPSTGSRARTG
jgi:hypothetical protein